MLEVTNRCRGNTDNFDTSALDSYTLDSWDNGFSHSFANCLSRMNRRSRGIPVIETGKSWFWFRGAKNFYARITIQTFNSFLLSFKHFIQEKNNSIESSSEITKAKCWRFYKSLSKQIHRLSIHLLSFHEITNSATAYFFSQIVFQERIDEIYQS